MATLPPKGFVFWPVGTGDSATIVVKPDVVMQVDINHMVRADEDDDPSLPIIDELIKLLPKKNKRPYLAAFVLTHPDTDHCRGFAELLDRVEIGELWFSPRVFLEHKNDLGTDAQAFQKEAKRRVAKTIATGDAAKSGDRVRIIGYHTELEDEEYDDFPDDRITVPGNEVTEIDGEDLTSVFRAFIHAPFKDDIGTERNDSCIGMQVSLTEGAKTARALLFGDLCYPTVQKIFERSQPSDLEWNLFLAPHHCSKSVMYWADDADDEEELKQDLLDAIDNAAASDGYVIVSSNCIPKKNKPGDNPPHAIAKDQYDTIAPKGVLCTMEYPNKAAPTMMVFKMTASGLTIEDEHTIAKAKDGGARLHAGIDAARGAPQPPIDRVGFG